jgi:hypothetical protein
MSLDKLIEELSKDIICSAHENCEMWEEEHKTDFEALDNSHESFWLEFLENGISDKEFTEKQYYEAWDIAYDRSSVRHAMNWLTEENNNE